MIEIALYTILIIIVIIIIGVAAYYLNDYLNNKKKVDKEFNETADYINTNFDNVDNKFNKTTDYVNTNFSNINNTTSHIKKNINLLNGNINNVNNNLRKNTNILDNKINNTNNKLLNTNNDLDILDNNINYTNSKVGNINSNLHDYFSFGNTPQTNNLLYNYVTKSIIPDLNILSSVTAASGLTIKTNPIINDPNNLRVCNNNNISPQCVNLNVNRGSFNITPEVGGAGKLVMNNQSGNPLASFNLNDNSIYLGINNDSDNAAMYIKDNNFYVKNINLVKDPTKQYSALTSSDVVPFGFESLSAIATDINALQTGIKYINILSAGSGYSSTPNVSIITANGDSGLGAIAQATITNGIISSINLISNGQSYKIPPLITIDPPANVGKIIAINVNNTGYGYFIAPTITIAGGSATAVAIVSNGIITAINVTNPGSGYTTAPAVTIISNNNLNNGTIINISITNAGIGYTLPPTISFIGPGTGASVTCTISAAGNISGITVVNGGSGYTTSTVIVFTNNINDKTGSSATAVISSVGILATATSDIGTQATAQAILYNPIVFSST